MYTKTHTDSLNAVFAHRLDFPSGNLPSCCAVSRAMPVIRESPVPLELGHVAKEIWRHRDGYGPGET